MTGHMLDPNARQEEAGGFKNVIASFNRPSNSRQQKQKKQAGGRSKETEERRKTGPEKKESRTETGKQNRRTKKERGKDTDLNTQGTEE